MNEFFESCLPKHNVHPSTYGYLSRLFYPYVVKLRNFTNEKDFIDWFIKLPVDIRINFSSCIKNKTLKDMLENFYKQILSLIGKLLNENCKSSTIYPWDVIKVLILDKILNNLFGVTKDINLPVKIITSNQTITKLMDKDMVCGILCFYELLSLPIDMYIYDIQINDIKLRRYKVRSTNKFPMKVFRNKFESSTYLYYKRNTFRDGFEFGVALYGDLSSNYLSKE